MRSKPKPCRPGIVSRLDTLCEFGDFRPSSAKRKSVRTDAIVPETLNQRASSTTGTLPPHSRDQLRHRAAVARHQRADQTTNAAEKPAKRGRAALSPLLHQGMARRCSSSPRLMQEIGKATKPRRHAALPIATFAKPRHHGFRHLYCRLHCFRQSRLSLEQHAWSKPLMSQLSIYTSRVTVAYAHLPAKIDALERKMLKATIDGTRLATATPTDPGQRQQEPGLLQLTACSGDDPPREFRRAHEFTLTQGLYEARGQGGIDDPCEPRRRDRFDEFTNLLWRNVFAKRVDGDFASQSPSPTHTIMHSVSNHTTRTASSAYHRMWMCEQVLVLATWLELHLLTEEMSLSRYGLSADGFILQRRSYYLAASQIDQTALAFASDESMVYFDDSLGLGNLGGEPSPEVSPRRASARLVETSRRASAVSAGGGDSLDLDELADKVRYEPHSVDSIRGWLGRARRIDRDLAPPEDPEEMASFSPRGQESTYRGNKTRERRTEETHILKDKVMEGGACGQFSRHAIVMGLPTTEQTTNPPPSAGESK
ncbi:hypothetical protein CONLIGDRAFT_693929 [Coniochaeta ligniaria NRRL 30616]|uniref:Uncharacterized protein n=1 Tax=Coniochaeta ligniaria NRRL 30616 TaxID=1408157 RepID=A0A1J7I7G4_9PEZI|nr:hypothetical protein CONLIGDRAFT_693929 [Coniochaeta ligniaria NRRL 30616]